MNLLRAALVALLALVSSHALSQSTPLQGGAWTSGHAPMYSGFAGSQPVIQDSGPAGGGATGLGLSEFLQVNRGNGAAPYANTGTGPYFTHNCAYDGPTTGPYHFFCLDANAQGSELLAVGAGGGASQLPLVFLVNGVSYSFPFTTGGVIGPGASTPNDLACWNNTAGTLLKDCGAQITGPATSTSSDVACWNNTTGTALKDCGPLTLDAILSYSGASPIGAVYRNGANNYTTIDFTNAANITSGTLNINRLPYVVPSGSTQTQINAALAGGSNVILPLGATYTLTGPIIHQPNLTIQAWGATINVQAGYATNYMIQAAQNARVLGGIWDGTNLPVPTGPWLGVGVPVGVVVSGNGPTTNCDNFYIDGATLQNTPSGPFFMRQCNAPVFKYLNLNNIQTYTANITNAGIEVYGGSSASLATGNGNYTVIDHVAINGYNWKGYHVGNTIGGRISFSRCDGAGQNTGHACLYEDGSVETDWIGDEHIGPGWAFKAHNFTRSTIVGINCDGSAGCIEGQGGTDIKVIGGTYSTPGTTGSYGVDLEAISGAGSLTGALIDGMSVRYTTSGTSASQTCFRELGDASDTITHVIIRNSTCDKAYFGHNTYNVASTTYDDINLLNNVFTNIVAYGDISYVKSGSWRGNSWATASGTAPCIAVLMAQGTTAGTRVTVEDNVCTGPLTTTAGFQLGDYAQGAGVTQWQSLAFNRNTQFGGGTMASIGWSVDANDYVNDLEITGDKHLNATAGNSITVSANPVSDMGVIARVTGNSFQVPSTTSGTALAGSTTTVIKTASAATAMVGGTIQFSAGGAGPTSGSAGAGSTATVINTGAALSSMVGSTLTFTSGANAGSSRVIASAVAGTSVKVSPGFPAAPATSDTFTVQPIGRIVAATAGTSLTVASALPNAPAAADAFTVYYTAFNAFQFINQSAILLGSVMDWNEVGTIYNRPALMKPYGPATVAYYNANIPPSVVGIGARGVINDGAPYPYAVWGATATGGGSLILSVFSTGSAWIYQ